MLVDYSLKSNFLPQTEDKSFPLTKEICNALKKPAKKRLLNHSQKQGYMLTGKGTASSTS